MTAAARPRPGAKLAVAWGETPFVSVSSPCPLRKLG